MQLVHCNKVDKTKWGALGCLSEGVVEGASSGIWARVRWLRQEFKEAWFCSGLGAVEKKGLVLLYLRGRTKAGMCEEAPVTPSSTRAGCLAIFVVWTMLLSLCSDTIPEWPMSFLLEPGHLWADSHQELLCCEWVTVKYFHNLTNRSGFFFFFPRCGNFNN